MQTEFIAVPPFWTVGQTIDFMRETDDLPDKFYEIFVVDPGGHLLGTVAARQAPAHQAPGDDRRDHERRSRTGSRPTETRRRWRACSSATTWSSAAVVDEGDRLVGVMTVDDIVDVIEEEADDDIKRSAASKPDEELSDTVWDIVQEPLRPGCSSTSAPRFSPPSVISLFEGSLAEDGGARRADADRRLAWAAMPARRP